MPEISNEEWPAWTDQVINALDCSVTGNLAGFVPLYDFKDRHLFIHPAELLLRGGDSDGERITEGTLAIDFSGVVALFDERFELTLGWTPVDRPAVDICGTIHGEEAWVTLSSEPCDGAEPVGVIVDGRVLYYDDEAD
jgi:hypothetical protein